MSARSGDRLVFEPGVLESIVERAAVSPGEETCGVLTGRAREDGWRVTRAHPAANTAPPRRRRRRYVMDPADVLRALHAAGREGDDLVGFWHSHPDGGTSPSAVDRERAWPRTPYVIVALPRGGQPRVAAWMRPGENADFVPLRLELGASGGVSRAGGEAAPGDGRT